MEATIEQRKDNRNSVSWPVSVWMPDANRFFYGRSCNISRTGVFITLPVTTPIQTGHVVELNFPRTEELAKEKAADSLVVDWLTDYGKYFPEQKSAMEKFIKYIKLRDHKKLYIERR